MKIFVKKKTKDATAKKMLKTVLDIATKEIENPDVRDRGFIYLRLLTNAPEAAKQVVLSARPHVVDNNQVLDNNTLRELIANMSSLSSVYHKPPNMFVPQMRVQQQKIHQKTPSSEPTTPQQLTPVYVEQNVQPVYVEQQNVVINQVDQGSSRTINLLGL